MKWVNLTDMLFCKAYGHLFVIRKAAFRNDNVHWSCIDNDKNIIAEGNTVKLTDAKGFCKGVYLELKQVGK